MSEDRVQRITERLRYDKAYFEESGVTAGYIAVEVADIDCMLAALTPPHGPGTELQTLMADLTDHALSARHHNLEVLAAAYLAATNLPPERVEMVEETKDGKQTWYFREREGSAPVWGESPVRAAWRAHSTWHAWVETLRGAKPDSAMPHQCLYCGAADGEEHRSPCTLRAALQKAADKINAVYAGISANGPTTTMTDVVTVQANCSMVAPLPPLPDGERRWLIGDVVVDQLGNQWAIARIMDGLAEYVPMSVPWCAPRAMIINVATTGQCGSNDPSADPAVTVPASGGCCGSNCGSRSASGDMPCCGDEAPDAAEPPCVCRDPSAHEAGCEWKRWSDLQRQLRDFWNGE